MIGFWFGIVIFGGLFSCAVIWVAYMALNASKVRGKGLIACLIGLTIFIGSVTGGNWWLNNTASGLRIQISWQAEMNIGLYRNVQVFTATGELVYEYQGRFDVDQNDHRIILDIINEENRARRVYISAPAGVVIISEIAD